MQVDCEICLIFSLLTAIEIYTGWLIKNVPNFAMMLYCSTIEFKQKEITFLKSSWEIMTLYTSVLTVKYAKKYWVSKTHKIANKFNASHCMRSTSSHSDYRKMCWIAPPFCFLTAFSRFFSIYAMYFRTMSMVTSFHLFLIAFLRLCRFANVSRRPS